MQTLARPALRAFKYNRNREENAAFVMTSANQGCCLMSGRPVTKGDYDLPIGDQKFKQGARQGHLKRMILRLALGE